MYIMCEKLTYVFEKDITSLTNRQKPLKRGKGDASPYTSEGSDIKKGGSHARKI